MKEGRTAKVQLMVEPTLIKRVEDWRFANRVGTRSMAMRQLMGQALNEYEKSPAGAPTPPDHDQNPTSQKDGGIDA